MALTSFWTPSSYPDVEKPEERKELVVKLCAIASFSTFREFIIPCQYLRTQETIKTRRQKAFDESWRLSLARRYRAGLYLKRIRSVGSNYAKVLNRLMIKIREQITSGYPLLLPQTRSLNARDINTLSSLHAVSRIYY